MTDKNGSKIIKFADVEKDLLKALNKKNKTGELKLPESADLATGFVNQMFSNELSNSFTLGGPTVPMVLLVGKSGQIYFFALKILLPEIFK
jgi:hypothetical protein